MQGDAARTEARTRPGGNQCVASGAMNDTFESVTSLRARLNVLLAEHRDLDEAIARLAALPPTDDLLVRRLKKRKLFVKDRILLIERLMDPDVPA